MFSQNLKYYRLKNNLTKTDLAKKVGLSAMAITNYENGMRRPDMPTIKALASALGIRTVDFLTTRNSNLSFAHGEFRKNTKMTLSQQEYVREAIEEYFSRFFEAVEVLGGEVLYPAPELHSLPLSMNPEENGAVLRRYMNISEHGPIGNMIELLENRGILVFLLDIDNNAFSGMNGSVNGRPYIAVNQNMTAERIRTTIGHEIAHFAFAWPDDMASKEAEDMATAIAGAFLFPKDDAIRELGIERRSITTDMYMVCKEYGIAMSLLVFRAHLCNIIKDNVYKRYFVEHSRIENSRIEKEKTALFEQLVYRAVNENEISIQKGSELLKIPYSTVAENCRFAEG